MNSLGNRLKTAREYRRMSQQQVSDKVGMSQPSYYKIESGRTKRTSYINELANVLGVSIKWLADGEGDMIPNKPVKPSDDIISVPVVSVRDFAGFFGGAQAGRYKMIVDDKGYSDNIYFALVSDDSMSPTYLEGDLLLIDGDRLANEGDDVIATNGFSSVLRRYKKDIYDSEGDTVYSQLIPLNNFYSIIDSRAGAFDVKGVVIELYRVI